MIYLLSNSALPTTLNDFRGHLGSCVSKNKQHFSMSDNLTQTLDFAVFSSFIMAAQWGRPLYFAAVVSFFFFFLSFFFSRQSQRSQIECLLHFHTCCGLCLNLECRSEMCCTRLAENTGRKNLPKIRCLRTIAQLCRAITLQLMRVSTIGKLVKQQYRLHMSSQYGESRPTNG